MRQFISLLLLLVYGCGAYEGAQARPPAPEIRASITAIASEIHLFVFSAGQENGVVEGAEFQITRGEKVVGTGVVAKVDDKWSAARIWEVKGGLMAGDAVRINPPR
jgi:hypothetical protein